MTYIFKKELRIIKDEDGKTVAQNYETMESYEKPTLLNIGMELFSDGIRVYIFITENISEVKYVKINDIFIIEGLKGTYNLIECPRGTLIHLHTDLIEELMSEIKNNKMAEVTITIEV